MDLLLKLDFIEGSDPMIRDGKRSITRDLIGFMDLVDGFSVKRNELSSRVGKSVRYAGSDNNPRVSHSEKRVGAVECKDFGSDKRILLEKIRGQVEKIQRFSRASQDDDENVMELENSKIFVNGKYGVSPNRRGVFVKRHGELEAKVRRSVNFAENGNVHRIISSSGEAGEPVLIGDCNSSDGSDSVDAERVFVDNLGREIEEIRVSSKKIG
ncbi:unnamed protein product [Ilex paraguariensis]|uniref:Uncharacterized protein n=1 Tax=Ilex paraguariensis TaxID=185542 RepID=A0ABC8T0R2_9AQUA